MRFDLVKQPLLPALFTLLLLALVGLSRAAAGPLPADPRWGVPAEALPLLPAASALAQFGAAFPLLTKLLGGLILLYTGAMLGRLSVRCNLYGTSTCLAIPLYGTAMLGPLTGGAFAEAIVASMLLMLSVRNFCLGYQNGFGFDRLFRGALFLGLLLLTEPAAAPLVVLLPSAIIRFRRTSRELLVAVAGLLFPLAAAAYINWGLGGTLAAPFEALFHRAAAGGWGALAQTAPTALLPYVVLLFAANLAATLLFRANSYNVGTRARHILLFTTQMLLWCLLTLVLPGASVATLALTAVPSALLLPVLFIRIRRRLARLLYLLWVAGALAVLFAG